MALRCASRRARNPAGMCCLRGLLRLVRFSEFILSILDLNNRRKEETYFFPPKDCAISFRFHLENCPGGFLGPWEVSAEEGASEAIEHEILGASLDRLWYVG